MTAPPPTSAPAAAAARAAATGEAPPRAADRDRERAVRRVVLIVLVLNLVVAVAKAIYGLASGSLAVSTDAVHSFLDASGNVIALVALKIAAAPPDRGHPYGHRKIEIVAAAAVGVLITAGVINFGVHAIDALRSGEHAAPPGVIGFAVVGGTFVVNAFVSVYESRRGSRLSSAFLVADAAHTVSDVLVTLTVLVSMAAARLGVGWADPVAALVVLVFVARVAWRILAGNLSVLVDAAVIDPERVVQIALSVAGVRGCHRVRSRGTDFAAHVDLHLLFDNDISLRAAHELAHTVESALRREIPAVVDVTIHMEPEESGYEQL